MMTMKSPVVPNYREIDLTVGARTVVNPYTADKGLKSHMSLLRFVKLFLFSAVLVSGYLLVDVLVVNPPIETLGSKPGIEQRYQQMMRYRLSVQDADE